MHTPDGTSDEERQYSMMANRPAMGAVGWFDDSTYAAGPDGVVARYSQLEASPVLLYDHRASGRPSMLYGRNFSGPQLAIISSSPMNGYSATDHRSFPVHQADQGDNVMYGGYSAGGVMVNWNPPSYSSPVWRAPEPQFDTLDWHPSQLSRPLSDRATDERRTFRVVESVSGMATYSGQQDVQHSGSVLQPLPEYPRQLSAYFPGIAPTANPAYALASEGSGVNVPQRALWTTTAPAPGPYASLTPPYEPCNPTTGLANEAPGDRDHEWIIPFEEYAGRRSPREPVAPAVVNILVSGVLDRGRRAQLFKDYSDPAFPDPERRRKGRKFTVRFVFKDLADNKRPMQRNEYHKSERNSQGQVPLSLADFAVIIVEQLGELLSDKQLRFRGHIVDIRHLVIVEIRRPSTGSVQPVFMVGSSFRHLYG